MWAIYIRIKENIKLHLNKVTVILTQGGNGMYKNLKFPLILT